MLVASACSRDPALSAPDNAEFIPCSDARFLGRAAGA
jgi:hypothetical protein